MDHELLTVTRQRAGLLICILGTYLLARAVTVKMQKGIGVQTLGEDGKPISPNQTEINQKLYRFGLFCVGLGTLLQW